MSNVLRSRQQASPQTAISVAGQEEPVEPAYWKPVAPSPIKSHLGIPSESVTWKAPIVARGQRMTGMRYLYAHGAVRMPITPIGTGGPDIGQAVWSSDFQPDQVGPIYDWGFNDALFQAGYPGFNLGLSFKVQKLVENPTGGPGYNMRYRTPLRKWNVRNQAGNITYNRTG